MTVFAVMYWLTSQRQLCNIEHCCWVSHLVSQWVTLSVRNTKVLHQTLNPTAELWCKTLSRIMFGIKPRFYVRC